jgi:hypothetical protein
MQGIDIFILVTVHSSSTNQACAFLVMALSFFYSQGCVVEVCALLCKNQQNILLH